MEYKKNLWELRMEFIANYPKTIQGAIKMIEDMEKDLDSSRVSVSHKLEEGFFGGIEIKIASPYLTYHKPRYADGGDSILLGVDTMKEMVRHFRRDYRISNDTDVLYEEMDVVYEFLEIAKKISAGEVMEYSAIVSDRAAESWILNHGHSITLTK
ncbi:hypothetical protein [Paenibacillus hubeiensis]|uniref:hypothetical protein n=1 Tax=Paenibacillus hubeiensis TaxID=3077330 RepID=UPI0031B9E0D3